MKIPIGHETRDVTEKEVRDAQIANLKRKISADQRMLIDAILSHFAKEIHKEKQ